MASRLTPASPGRRRGGLLVRLLLATVGAYAFAVAGAFALARLIPGPRDQAALWATILSYALLAGAVVWTFAAASAGRAARGLLGATAVAAVITAGSIALWGRL